MKIIITTLGILFLIQFSNAQVSDWTLIGETIQAKIYYHTGECNGDNFVFFKLEKVEPISESSEGDIDLPFESHHHISEPIKLQLYNNGQEFIAPSISSIDWGDATSLEGECGATVSGPLLSYRIPFELEHFSVELTE